MIKKIKVLLGTPTFNSIAYIDTTIKLIKNEISLCKNIDKSIDISLAIGVDGDKATYSYLRYNYKDDPLVTLLYTKTSGKNSSINQIIDFAKDNFYDILHWFDDDVFMKNGTLHINLKQLIFNLHNNTPPQIVASIILAKERDFNFFIKRYGLFKGIKSYYYYLIFSLPFRHAYDHPNFCMGMSYGLLVRDTPYYPSSETFIADDGFIGNYYAVVNKSRIIENQFSPIIHVSESEAYFDVAISLKDWIKQQSRIYVGVMYSYFYFKNEVDFLRNYFAWYYSHDIKGNFNYHSRNHSHKILYFLYGIYQTIMLRKAKKILKNKTPLKWNTLYTTKGL